MTEAQNMQPATIVDTSLVEAPDAPQGDPLISLIDRVIRDPKIDLDRVERIFAIRDGVQAKQAAADYARDFSAMQGELPSVVERGTIKNKQGAPQSSYALWEDINAAIKPILTRYGFGLSFRTPQEEGAVTVTAILTHSSGHHEETTMRLPTDTTGSKNSVQAIASSTSYGKRYTAGALLNLTSHGEDDDGERGGGSVAVTDEQAAEIDGLLEAIDATEEEEAGFLKWLKVKSVSEIPARLHPQAVAKLRAKGKQKGFEV